MNMDMVLSGHTPAKAEQVVWSLTRDSLTARVYKSDNPRGETHRHNNRSYMAIFQDWDEQFLGDPPDTRPDGCETLEQFREWLKRPQVKEGIAAVDNLYPVPFMTRPCFNITCVHAVQNAVGAIYVTHERLDSFYGSARLIPQRKDSFNLQHIMSEEVRAYNRYLVGNIYRWEVLQDVPGKDVRRCLRGSPYTGSLQEAETKAMQAFRVCYDAIRVEKDLIWMQMQEA